MPFVKAMHPGARHRPLLVSERGFFVVLREKFTEMPFLYDGRDMAWYGKWHFRDGMENGVDRKRTWHVFMTGMKDKCDREHGMVA